MSTTISSRPVCSVDQCAKPTRTRGLCDMHYMRLLRHGTTETSVHPDIQTRFWSHVDKDGPVPAHCPELGPCWLWSRGRHRKTGYGMVKLYHRTRLAHRVAYEIVTGPIPDGLLVMHRCDSPPCVNPSHLMLGDHAANQRDCVTKGRKNSPHGTMNSDAKLTDDAVRAIRRRRVAGETGKVLALEYGVTPATICDVFKGRNWKHVT